MRNHHPEHDRLQPNPHAHQTTPSHTMKSADPIDETTTVAAHANSMSPIALKAKTMPSMAALPKPSVRCRVPALTDQLRATDQEILPHPHLSGPLAFVQKPLDPQHSVVAPPSCHPPRQSPLSHPHHSEVDAS